MPVDALTVRPVTLVLAFHAVPLPATVQVPEPSVRVLVPAPSANDPTVTALSFAFNVPLVSVIDRVESITKLSSNLNVPPTPLKITGLFIV